MLKALLLLASMGAPDDPMIVCDTVQQIHALADTEDPNAVNEGFNDESACGPIDPKKLTIFESPVVVETIFGATAVYEIHRLVVIAHGIPLMAFRPVAIGKAARS